MNPGPRFFACLLALAPIGAQPPDVAAAEAPPVPLKHFARHAEFESARISPTGDYLAVAMPVEGQTALGIIDLKNHKVAGQLRFPKGNEVADYRWVGPKRVVVSVAKSFGPLDQPALTGELYGIDADGSHKTYLFGYRGADQTSAHSGVKAEYAAALVVNALPHDPGSALIKVYQFRNVSDARGLRSPVIDKLDVATGKRERVAIVPGYEPLQALADRGGRLRFAVSNDQDSQDRLYARVDTGWKEVAQPGDASVVVDLHRATADGQSVFLTTDDGAANCLREYRFDTGVLKERRCSNTGAVGSPVFGFDEDTLLGVMREDGRPEFEAFEPGHPDAVLIRSLGKAFGGQRVSVTSHTLDGKRVLVLVDSDRNPGDYYLVDRLTKKADYLLSRRAWIDPAAMAPSEAISYKTRDGATIHGYLTARGGLATRKAPLVLMPHGGPHGPRDFWGWDPWAQALASRDYAVLQVNFRGSGGYGEAHQRAGYRKWGTLMQDDLTDAVRWAISQGIADPGRVCIMGGSYGGYAALMSAVREPDLYRCAVGLAGVYDLESQSDDSDIAESLMGRNYLRKVLGDDAVMREQSPVTHIARLKAAVLIAHGTADKRVPFSQAKILRKALQKHGKSYEWAEYAGEQHGFYKEANGEDFLGKVLAFLDKHIGRAADGAPAP